MPSVGVLYGTRLITPGDGAVVPGPNGLPLFGQGVAMLMHGAAGRALLQHGAFGQTVLQDGTHGEATLEHGSHGQGGLLDGAHGEAETNG